VKKTTKAADTPKEAHTETPRDRFMRLAPARTAAALKRIELLGNLTGSGYSYEPEEAQQVLDALFDAVHDLKRKFEKAKARKSGRTVFTFASSRKKEAQLAS
jgi:hypothetical protein